MGLLLQLLLIQVLWMASLPSKESTALISLVSVKLHLGCLGFHDSISTCPDSIPVLFLGHPSLLSLPVLFLLIHEGLGLTMKRNICVSKHWSHPCGISEKKELNILHYIMLKFLLYSTAVAKNQNQIIEKVLLFI